MATDVALEELSGLLWSERELLDRLEYALVAEQLILRSGQVRWLARASDEVSAVLEAIRDAELARAVRFAAVAAELGLKELPPLRELSPRLPLPWPDVFAAHRRALRTQTGEIRRLGEETRALLAADSRFVGAALEDLGAWTGDGEGGPGELALHLVAHQVATRSAMTVAVEVLHPSLVEFLS